uniref:Uncharacterized protein n=1 Tax=Cacopsylla melanoneura TaxID=428564 RepID=A0A8D9F134_9HEMI
MDSVLIENRMPQMTFKEGTQFLWSVHVFRSRAYARFRWEGVVSNFLDNFFILADVPDCFTRIRVENFSHDLKNKHLVLSYLNCSFFPFPQNTSHPDFILMMIEIEGY